MLINELEHTIHLVWVCLVSRKETFNEHVEAGDPEAFRTTEGLLRRCIVVGPGGSCSSIEENRDEEEVKETSADLLRGGWIGRVLPFVDQRLYSWHAGIKMAPATVRRNLNSVRHMYDLSLVRAYTHRREIGAEIPLVGT